MSDTRLSVVIPTYYRGRGIEKTLSALLRSDVSSVAPVEIVVVDDGSPVPVKPVVDRFSSTRQISIRLISQVNAGPAAARNRGFFETRGEIVLFMDDDILPGPDLLQSHCEGHRLHPGSVIHGPCPFAEDNGPKKLRRYLNALSPDSDATKEFVRMTMVASGQLSVERTMFDDAMGVYRTDLRTPAAEEFELAWRLSKLGIPVLQAKHIRAIHDHPVEMGSICTQQYKHALGYAEAAVKYPETVTFEFVAPVLSQNGPLRCEDSLSTKSKKILKMLLAGAVPRDIVRRTISPAAEFLPYSLSAPLTHFVVGLYFFAGVRDGLGQFSPSPRETDS